MIHPLIVISIRDHLTFHKEVHLANYHKDHEKRFRAVITIPVPLYPKEIDDLWQTEVEIDFVQTPPQNGRRYFEAVLRRGGDFDTIETLFGFADIPSIQ